MSKGNVYEKLQSYSKRMELNEAVTENEISSFEKENKIEIPKDYTELLKHFDGGELFVPGTILYGIAHSAGNHTLSEINLKRQIYRLPDTMLIIGKLNYGDILCIDLNNQNVVQWDHELNVEFCRWNSLEEWLEETIKNSD